MPQDTQIKRHWAVYEGLAAILLIVLIGIGGAMLLYRQYPSHPPLEITPAPTQELKININTASAGLLELLPEIGPAKAKAIIEYRELHGPFQRVEDLDNVSGIGPVTVEKIKDLITVD